MDAQEHKEYLHEIPKAKGKQLKVLIEKSNERQLNFLAELFVNFKSFVITKKEHSIFYRYRSIIKNFAKRKWTYKNLKKFLTKHSRLLVLIVISFLAKAVEGVLCAVLSNNG